MAHKLKSTAPRRDVEAKSGMKDRGERGDTLIEVLMALLVLGLTALALIIAFSTSVSASQRHRDIATANIVLGTASQQALAQIQQNPNFFGCQAPGVTDTAFVQSNVTLPVAPNVYDGFAPKIDSIQYWNGSSFQSTCVPGSNPPLQVVIEVDGNGEQYFNTFVVDLPSGNLGLAADTSNGVISQTVFENQALESATGSSGVAFSPQPVVSGLDSTDQVVRSNTVAFIPQIEGNPANATLTGCIGNDPNGVATFSGCVITGPAGTYHVHIEAFGGVPDSDPNGNAQNANSFHGATPLGFWETSPTWYATTYTVVVAGTPDKVVFAPAPVGGASGSNLSTQPTVKIETSLGVVDTTQNSTVTLSLTGGSLTGCANVNGPVTTSPDGETITALAHAGVLALTGCKFSGAIFFNGTASPAGPDPTHYTITASYAGAASTSSQLFVSAPGPASQLEFIQQPSGVSGPTKTAVFPVQPQVEIEDAFGNPAYTPAPGTVKIVFDPSDVVHEVLGGCSGSMVANTAIEVFSGCSGSAYGGNLEFLASYNGLTLDSSRFAISSGVGSLQFTTSPVAGPSGSAFTTQPVVTIFDNATPPNVDTGYSGTITLTSNGGTLSGCTNLTPNNGVVDAATCLFSGNAGTSYQLTASIVLPPPPVGGTTISATSTPFSPSQAGAATKLQFTNTVAAGAVAGSLMATQPIVRVEDSQGNVVTNSTATIKLTPSGGTLAGCANLTAVAGVVNASGCTFGGLIGSSYTLTASSGGLTSAISNSFNSNTAAGTESGVLISALPSTVPVSSVTNVQLNLQVVDTWGNATVGNGTTTLFVSASPTTKGFFSTTIGSSGPLGVTANVTIPPGAPGATIFYGDETVGSPQITAFDSQTSVAFGSASLTITPAVPTQLAYSTGPPLTTTAGSTFPVIVTEEDQFGNPVTTDNTTLVTLSATNGTSGGGFNCGSPTTIKVVAGVATFTNCSYTSASTTAYTLTAATAGLSSATANTTVSAGAAAQVFVWGGNDQSTKINTAFASPLSALVTDGSGNPVAGATVTFTNQAANPNGRFRAAGPGGPCLASGGGAVTACTATTNAAGIASSLTFTAFTTPGQYNVTASIPGGHSATFVETNTSTVLVFLTAAQEFATPTATPSGSVTIQEQDGAGNPIVQATNLTVNLTYNKPGTVAGPATVVILAGASSASFTMTAASATGTTFTVTAANAAFPPVSQTETVDPTSAPINTTVTVAGPQTVSAANLTATFPVLISNTSAGFTTLRYSVAGVNGDFAAGESSGPSATCVRVTGGNHTTIDETFTASSSRPSGAYTLGFVVDVYTGNNCFGTPTVYVGDATLNVTTRATEIDVNGGYAQTATHGASFASALSAVVVDGAGNAVAGVLVTFTAPTTGPSGTFLAASNGGTCLATGGIAVTSCTATTNASGVASSLTFTANAITGSYGVSVTTPFALPSPLVFEEENQ